MYTFQNGYYSAKADQLLKVDDYINLKADPLYFEYLKNKGFGYSEDINELYNQQIKLLYKDLTTTLENNPAIKLFFYSFDQTNTKIIYKHIHHQTLEESKDLGNIKPLAIYNAIKHQDYSLLDNEDKEIFIALNRFKGSHREVGEYIDYLFYKRKYELATTKELKDYLDTEVTLLNILSVLRSYKSNLKPSILPFGLVDKVLEEEAFIDYALSIYINKLNGLKSYKNDKDLEKLSVSFQRDFYAILKDHSYNIDSLGIVMLYVYRKMMELENIKMIYYDRDVLIEDLVIL